MVPKTGADTTIKAYHVGCRVWVPASEKKGHVPKTPVLYGTQGVTGWVEAHVTRVVELGGGDGRLDVKASDGRELAGLEPGSCLLQNDSSDIVEDLVDSDFLHEPGILHTLQVRYALDNIYTYSGNILIAVNPHKRLRHLYGSRMMSQYRGLKLGDLSPHVYAIAEQAFNLMMIDQQPQSVLISGESGAGKTETAKSVMQYLASRGQPIAPTPAKAGVVHGDDEGATIPIEEQVLESNPLLEAFGNAKTSRNNNSSRFGKFVEIGFDDQGRVMGASISTFLLERSRVVAINAPERSYHIFYQLCAGASAEQKKALHLEGGAESFRYLQASRVYKLQDIDDTEAFKETCGAMRIVGLTDDDIAAVFKAVAIVLHLGNITFGPGPSDGSVISNPDAVAVVAELMGVDVEKLSAALLTRTIETVGEKITKPLSTESAAESRDAFAKTLYGALFDWLVAAVNRRIATLGSGASHAHTIGILDIYGFESFEDNSFEQLCINLANERLQQQFNKTIFKEEQEEYEREGIDWSYVEFVDNQDTLDLLEGSPSEPARGVFPLLDEACRLPRATAADLAHTVRSRLEGLPRFEAPKKSQHSFTVEHYAGQVMYNSALLLDKNRDYLVAEHQDLMAASSVPFLRVLLEAQILKPQAAAPSGPSRSAFKLSTVGDRFRKQLKLLADTLNRTNPHFIRCVKPNAASKPGSLETEYTLGQLRAGGVLEAVRIACAGFPTRKPFAQLLARYGLLLSGLEPEAFLQLRTVERSFMHGLEVEVDVGTQQALLRRLLKQQGLEGWQIGHTRAFLRSGQLAHLEGIRGSQLSKSAVIMQAAVRRFLARLLLKRSRAAAVTLQAAWRGRAARIMAAGMRRERAARRIQGAFRIHVARGTAMELRKERSVVKLQAWARMVLVKRKFERDTDAGRRAAEKARKSAAATVLQSHWRRLLAARKAQARRAEAKRLEELQHATEALRVESDDARRASEAARSERDAAQMGLAAEQARSAELERELEKLRVELEAVKTASKATDQEAIEAQVRAAAAEAADRRGQQMEAELQQQREALAKGTTNLRAAEASLSERDSLLRDLKAENATLRSELAEMDSRMQHSAAETAKLREEMAALEASHESELAAVNLERVTLRDDLEAVKTEVHVQAAKVRQESAEHMASLRAENEATLERERARHKETQKRYYMASSTIVQLKKDLAEYQALEARAAEGNGPIVRAGVRKGLPDSGAPNPATGLMQGQREAVHVLCSAALRQGLLGRGLVTVEAKGLIVGRESVSFPVASWWVARALVQWRSAWGVVAFDGARNQVLGELRDMSVKEKGSLRSQAVLLSITIAMSGMLATVTSGTDMRLQQYAAQLLNMTELHLGIWEAISQVMSFIPRLIGSTAMRRKARHQSYDLRSPAAGGTPAAAAGAPGGANPWDELKEALGVVLLTLRDEAGLPPQAVTAVISSTLAHLDAELMNDLMTRRQSCSTSALKVLQLGTAEVREWAASEANWSGGTQVVDTAMRHVTQAVRYLINSKEDIIRKHVKGFDVMQDLARVCPSLTLQQVQRLTQCHHDDWVGHDAPSGAGLTLLKWIQQRANSEPLGHTIQQIANPSSRAVQPASNGAAEPPEDPEGDALLLDPRSAFKLSPVLLKAAARVYAHPSVVQAARGRINQLPLPADMEACNELSFLCS